MTIEVTDLATHAGFDAAMTAKVAELEGAMLDVIAVELHASLRTVTRADARAIARGVLTLRAWHELYKADRQIVVSICRDHNVATVSDGRVALGVQIDPIGGAR